jgi:RNA polymerase sigma-70 factor (ECF subfamily)
MLSLEEIWVDTSRRIWNFIRSRVEDDATADDLMQEVFVRVHQNMAQLKDTERIESWIYQITRPVIIDHYRTRRNLTANPAALPDPNEAYAEADAVKELSSSIRKMIDVLPEL